MSIHVGYGGVVRDLGSVSVGYGGVVRDCGEIVTGYGGVVRTIFAGLPPKGLALSAYTWEQIDEIGQAGKASEYFSVGDKKPFTIDGTSYNAIIMDFDHDDLTAGGKAPITFGLEGYLPDTYTMNSSRTNSGSWPACAAYSTLNTTIFGKIQADLKAVIKRVKKITGVCDGTQAGGSNVNSNDYLFLWAMKEICARTYSKSYTPSTQNEFNALTGYSYFSDEAASSPYDDCWLRSPAYDDEESFCLVDHLSSGSFWGQYDYASRTGRYYLTFGFCV